MENTQILLIGVVTALMILLILIGIQVFFILREIQKSVQKTNKMLDDMGVISESIAKPVASLSNSITGVSSIAGLFGWLSQRGSKSEKAEKKTGEENA